MTPSLRVPTDADVEDVARIMSEGWPEAVDAGQVRQAWASPGFDRERDARIAPGAYVHVEALDRDRVWINLRGRPSTALVDWAEGRARERGGRILCGSWAANESVLEELRRRGFRQIRHSFRMSISLEDEVPVPVVPAGVRLRTFEDGDERSFYDAQLEAFADTWEPIDHPYDEWAHWLLDTPSFDPELWFLAEVGGAVAGFAICRVHPGNSDLGWIQILGVRRPWRGKGIGRALLLNAFRALRARGLRRAGLGVDAENPTGATSLYESVGMRVVDRFELYETEHT
ncbi:MAG: putative acetyltransferase [Gaiellaceae bacterium]|jgi:ribosomal protein S18 acetylase RimI-like enzyme|nr:putative acetyltransferase [Gaiellaceae bacterium]